jgi:hypothetical protein
MPIYSPTGFLDITNATLRTSNLEAQNFRLNGGNIYVTSELTTDELLNLDNVVNAGNATSNTVQFTNLTTGLVADSNIVVAGNVTAGSFLGDGSGLTSIPPSAITGTLSQWSDGTNSDVYIASNVGIGNVHTLTSNTLQVGANLYVRDADANVLTVTGNVAADYFEGDGSKLTDISSNLEQIANNGNVTSNTVQFTNATTGLVTTGNVEVGKDLTVAGNVAVDTDTLFVDSVNDRVGVGTTDPSNRLHVVGTTNQIVQIQNTTDTARMVLNGASGTGGDLIFQQNGTATWGIASIGDKLHFLGDDSTSQYRMTLDNSGNVGIGTTDPGAPLSIFKQTTGGFSSPQYDGGGIYLSRYSDDPTNYYGGAIYSFYTNQGAGGDSGLAFKVTDGNTTNPYGSSSPNMVIVPSGNVGIGVTDPDGTLHVKAGNRMHITSGNTPAFTGLDSATSANGRAQLVLNSAYSDLVIASSFVNNNHGSTLSFTTVNPSNTAEYRKFVINQGNWGSRKDFLDFGLSASTADSNPHLSINSTDTVLTLDGNNKRVGIGKTDPQTTLDVNGTIYGSGSIVQVQHNFGNSSLSYSSNARATSGDIPLTSATGLKLSITPTKTTSKVHVNLNVLAYFNFGNGSNNGVRMQVWRKIGTTYTRVYGRGGSYHDLHWYNSVVTGNPHEFLNISFVDSPNTTLACEYELRAMFYSAPPSGGFLYIGNGGNQPATITLMEIGG